MSLLLFSLLLSAGYPSAHAPAKSLDPAKRPTQYVVRSWSFDDGLPQNTVSSIVQSRAGFLWIGTEEGIARFDGREFEVFSRSNSPSMISDNVVSLTSASGGELWFGTLGGGILRLRGQSLERHPGFPERATPGGFHLAADSTVWVAAWDQGLFRCGPEHCEDASEGTLLESAEVYVVTGSRGGDLWVGTSEGLYRLPAGRTLAAGASDPFELFEGSSEWQIQTIFADAGNNLWISTHEHGLFVRAFDGSLRRMKEEDGWPSERVWTIQQDQHGSLWFGLDSSGLLRLSNGETAAFTVSDGLLSGRVISIFEDREGNLWVGSERGGLHRFRDGAFTAIDRSVGLSGNDISTVFVDGAGVAWVGTFGDGLNRIDDRAVSHYSSRTGLSSDLVSGVISTPDGAVWVATLDGGLNRLEGGRTRVFGVQDGLPSPSIYAMSIDRQGALWLGTDEGLAVVEGTSIRVPEFNSRLSSPSVTAIAHGTDGALWVGTYGAGLNHVEGSEVTTWTGEDGLANDYVTTLHMDADGVLWIGTLDGGLSRIQDGLLITVTARDGLFDDSIFQILEDDAGWLWMGCNRGIFRIRKEDVVALSSGAIASIPYERFGTDDGMKTAEVNGGVQPGGWRGPDGRLWFPTIAGVVVVDPTDLRRNALPPPIVVQRMEADGAVVPLLGDVVLPSGTRRIEFKFAALSLVDAEAIQYRYRLVGEDETWQSAMSGNTANYTYLNPGHYTFQVAATNNDGVWNEDGASLSFHLRPYFYETRWFWMLAASIAFLAGAWFFRARTRHLMQQREQLEKMVEARTRDVMAAKDQIQAQSDQLRDSLREKEVLLREVHHRVKNNLQMISSLLQLQSRQVSDPATKERFDECRDRIYSFSMVHERLYMAKDMAHFDFADYLNGLTKQLVRSHDLGHMNIDLMVDNDGTNLDVERAIPCGLIVTEFITNAIRHAFATADSGQIDVEFAADGDEAVLTVEDDGRGLASGFRLGRQEGLGLKLVDALVSRLHGTLSVAPRPEGGTRCEVRFPINDSLTAAPVRAAAAMA